MEEQELLALIEKRSKSLNKKHHLLEATVHPRRALYRKPKKRKIKRIKQ